MVVGKNIVDLKEYREIDPLTNPGLKRLISLWHGGNIGGADRISHCVRGAFVGDFEDDVFKLIRSHQPKLLLILHPVLAAWARDEVCDVDYLMDTIPQRKAGVLMDWADTMCEEGIIQAIEQDGVVTYLPTRKILYKVFEGMSFLFDFFEHLFEEVPAAIEIMRNHNQLWISENTPIPLEKKDGTIG
jgi:hypothetical protein